MGASGSVSSSLSTIDTKNAVNALTENLMNCSGNANSSEDIIVSGSGNVLTNIKQVTYLKLSTQCAQSAQSMADLQSQITSALTNAATAQGTGVLSALGGSKSMAESRISNSVQQNITQKSVTDMVTSINAAQRLIVSGNNNILTNVSQETTSEVVQNAAQNLINGIVASAVTSSTSDTKSTAITTSPITEILDSIGKTLTDALGTLVTGAMVMWIIIAIVIIAAIYLLGPSAILCTLGLSSCDQPHDENAGMYEQDQQQGYGQGYQQGDSYQGYGQGGPLQGAPLQQPYYGSYESGIDASGSYLR